MISQITDQSATNEKDEEPFVEWNGLEQDSKREEKAKTLLDYAKRKLEEGNRDIAIKYFRRIAEEYSKTESAPEAIAQLTELRDSEPFRNWTDKSGKYSVRAKFVRLEKDTVYLKNEDDRVIAVDVRKLSHADRLYIIHREGLSFKDFFSDE